MQLRAIWWGVGAFNALVRPAVDPRLLCRARALSLAALAPFLSTHLSPHQIFVREGLMQREARTA